MIKKRINSYATPSYEEKLRYLKALDENNRNKSKTARELGISRKTLIRYEKEYWEDYLKNKKNVAQDSLAIEAKKLTISAELEEAKQGVFKTFNLAVGKIIDILNDPEQFKNLPAKDLIQLVNVLLPFVAERRANAGVKDDTNDPKSQHTTFVQNIINHMNNYRENQK